jgi:hypothetical protein
MSDEIEWNYDEFVTFVLLYASHVDMDFSEEERAKITERLPSATFDKMYATFQDMSDYEALQNILSYKGLYYPTPERKKELLDKIKLVFFADGDYSVMERELLHFLDKLM